MHVSIKLAVAALLGLPLASASAQNNAAICINGKNERSVYILANVSVADPNSCEPAGGQFLVQGRRSQFRVVNRKFLSDYSFTVDGTTQIQAFRIQGLEEASTLTIPLSAASTAVSKGAAPKGLSSTGALTLRTAQDLLAELTNPATSSNPPNEIQSDWLVVENEIKRLGLDQQAFDGVWLQLLGEKLPATKVRGNDLGCDDAYGDPTLATVKQCLQNRNKAAQKDSFDITATVYRDEDAFRQLIVTDTDAITMVTELGTKLNLQVPQLITQQTSLDGDLMQFRVDINTLEGNIKAAHDAAALARSLPPALGLVQIKLRLMNAFNSSKTIVDPVELNALSEKLQTATQSGPIRILLQHAADNLDAQKQIIDRNIGDAARNYARIKCDRVDSCGSQLDEKYQSVLASQIEDLNETLPKSVDTINAQQSQLLARTNDIYDKSAVDIALDKVVNLGKLKGNAYVYYTIRRIDSFTRFVVPAITVQGSAPGAAASALPTASGPAATTTASAGGPASTDTTTTTTATTTTTTTVTTPTSSSSSSSAGTTGTVVAHGVIEVHDIYQATVVAAFAFSQVKDSVQSSTVSTGNATPVPPATSGTPCTQAAPCSQVTAGPQHSSVIMGLSGHFTPYDTFPGAQRWTGRFGAFGGLSVQNVNDYYAALDYEPFNGVQLMGGVNFYQQNKLATGFTIGNIYTGTPTFTGPESWSKGAYFGLGLNLRIFRKIFGSATGVGVSATSSGNSSSSGSSSTSGS